MENKDNLHFNILKTKIESRYLENHTPSSNDITKWKGIDIIYFQEDLRKYAKGNISEKSFYTYFKTSNSDKLPRIDLLNLLSIYTGYKSWYDFKNNNPLEINFVETEKNAEILVENPIKIIENIAKPEEEKPVLQNNIYDNQVINTKSSKLNLSPKNNKISQIKKFFWVIISVFLSIILILINFWDNLFQTKYKFTFIDSDRDSKINEVIEVKILKEKESPIRLNLKGKEDLIYSTKDNYLKMVVTSPFYKQDTIIRKLNPENNEERIELEPDIYAQALYYYSTNKSNKKLAELNRIISNNALIYQVFDNDTYGIETLDKERYISLVLTPSNSLKNFKMIETKIEKGKIVLIKFKITQELNKN